MVVSISRLEWPSYGEVSDHRWNRAFPAASGVLTMTSTQMAVLRNASNATTLLVFTGEFEGTIAGAATEQESQGGRQ